MRRTFRDLPGQTIAGVHVLRRYGEPSARKWWCLCACGEKFAAATKTLLTNRDAGTHAGCHRCTCAKLGAVQKARRVREGSAAA